jgi:predicted Zn-dependent protease with MMP-like domain
MICWVKVSMEQFEAAVDAALDSIPQQFQPYLENTEVVIAETSGGRLLGLYEGATALHAGESFPERITIYKAEHERGARDYDELVERVRHTVLHEVGHHFGMDEDEMPF